MPAVAMSPIHGVVYHQGHLWDVSIDNRGAPTLNAPLKSGEDHELLGHTGVSIDYKPATDERLDDGSPKPSATLSFTKGQSFIFENPGTALIQEVGGLRPVHFPAEQLAA